MLDINKLGMITRERFKEDCIYIDNECYNYGLSDNIKKKLKHIVYTGYKELALRNLYTTFNVCIGEFYRNEELLPDEIKKCKMILNEINKRYKNRIQNKRR